MLNQSWAKEVFMLGNNKVLEHRCKEKQELLITSRRLWKIADNHGWERIIKSHQNKAKETALPVRSLLLSLRLFLKLPNWNMCNSGVWASALGHLDSLSRAHQRQWASWPCSTFVSKKWHLSAWWILTMMNSRDFSDSLGKKLSSFSSEARWPLQFTPEPCLAYTGNKWNVAPPPPLHTLWEDMLACKVKGRSEPFSNQSSWWFSKFGFWRNYYEGSVGQKI